MLLFAEAFAASGGELVILSAAVAVRCAPACFEQALADKAEQGGIERALFDQQRTAGNLLDAEENAITMEGAERHGLEDQEIESSGEQFGLRGQGAS